MTETPYLVCPACGGDHEHPRHLRSGNVWGDAELCWHAFHRSGEGYELTSPEEREWLDAQSEVPS